MGARIEGDMYVAGTLSSRYLTAPAGSIGNAEIESLAEIEQSKLEHQHRATYSQPNTTATTETRTLLVAYAAGTVLDVRAGCVGANVGAATVTFDVKKNGTTVLTGVITVSSSHAAYEDVAGTVVGSPTYVQGDVFTVVITATAGGGTLGTGAFVALTVKEDAQ